MAITNSAPHEFDVVGHFLGCDYARITAFQPRRSDALVAPISMVLETTGGLLTTVEINNNAAYGYDMRAELVDEAGSLATNPVAYTRRDAGLATANRYDSDWRDRYAEASRQQNKAFLAFVRSGHFPAKAADAWDGLAAALVAEAGVVVLREGHKVAVSRTEQPAFFAAKGGK